jgi:exopolyphosphatase/guanosine-5'-triphosphate,3'-diphosphate pyrophosphatase
MAQPTGSARRNWHGAGQTRPVYAALDLGTNNCRLLMAVPAHQGFRVVEAFSRTTRLGEGLAGSGLLSEAAVARTVAALKQCVLRMERRGVTRFRSVATEACRRAGNCRHFLDQVMAETGLEMEIISAEEEARLALAGCSPLLDRSLSDALVFDIGGGSTELMHVCVRRQRGDDEVLSMASLPLGVVTLAEAKGEALHTPAGYADTVNDVCRRLAAFDSDGALSALVRQGKVQMLGTSGTVTTLAGVHLRLPRYDRMAVDGLVMNFTEIETVSRLLAGSGPTERAAHPCIGNERADLVVAGCAILDAICRLWPVGRLRVADRGVREGVLMSMMRADRVWMQTR